MILWRNNVEHARGCCYEFVDVNDITGTGNDSVEGIMYNIHRAIIMTGEFVNDNDIIGTYNDSVEGLMYNMHEAVIMNLMMIMIL